MAGYSLDSIGTRFGVTGQVSKQCYYQNTAHFLRGYAAMCLHINQAS